MDDGSLHDEYSFKLNMFVYSEIMYRVLCAKQRAEVVTNAEITHMVLSSRREARGVASRS